MIRAVLLILEKEGKVLFAKRHDNRSSMPGRWSLPSGKIKSGERLFDAAIREAEEELGIHVFDLELFDTFHFQSNSEDKRINFVKADYSQEPKIMAEDELTELRRYSFKDFFQQYSDDEITHALQYLRRKLNF